MIQPEMKDLMIFALNLDILSISNYPGYKGALLVKIVVAEEKTLGVIHKYCNSKNIEVSEKFNQNMNVFESYCIFTQNDVYKLK